MHETHGYDISVGYTHGFYREMAPDWLDLAARLAGQPAPRTTPAAPFRYLELGAGQGFGLCLLAAANPQGEFVGVDFHPEHAAHAQRLAAEAGLANLRFVQADFLDLAAEWPADFGSFDYVALHGVLSWVPPQVRAAVIACIGHATHAGSLVYAGYNAHPGWLATMPFQHVSQRIKETTGNSGDAVFAQSIALFERLRAGGAATFRILPGLAARLDAVKARDTGYLVQEYLHAHWQPFWHSEVARELAPAGLAFAGTTTLAETMLPAILPPPLRQAILDQPDAPLRQDVQDFTINQSFRRDLFRRGDDAPAPQSLGQTRLRLLAPPAPGGTVKIDAAFGEIALQYPAFAGILQALGDGPQAIDQLAGLPSLAEQGAASVRQLLVLLLHAGVLGLASETSDNAAAHRFNAVIAHAAGQGAPYRYLAAPALGSAIPASEAELQAFRAGTPAAHWQGLGVA
ncbi:class I SAM-dependent methyltransferase [Sphingomonas sp. KR3-1]|uniref:class I SAM-dependent methyltransferase n=1 Tax=Sphingomonas sp. KR3-1 TaxID=3156611 RepID=UPI0032B4218B